MTWIAKRTAIALFLVASGWAVGRAQTPAPEFTLSIDAPAGQTKIGRVQGCTLQGGRDEGNPNNTPLKNYVFDCRGGAAHRCNATVNGWLTR